MKNSKLLALSATIAALGWVGAASAAPIITNISASGPGLGSFSSQIDEDNRSIDLLKTFESLNPITLTFTVEHSTGPANPYEVSEEITNNSGVDWRDFHFEIVEPPDAPGNGVVFTSFNQSTLTGFTLDAPPSSGPRNLNFTGFLANGGTTDADFNISPFDPGEGNTSTFSLIQTPTIPEPGTWAMLVAGFIGVLGMVRRRIGS